MVEGARVSRVRSKPHLHSQLSGQRLIHYGVSPSPLYCHTMDKVAIFSASLLEPTVISPHSTLLAHLGRTLALPTGLHQIISSISLFIFLQAYFIVHATLIGSLYASKFLAFQTFLATRFGLAMSSKAVFHIWDSKAVQSLRTKLFYEFAVFILGSGNSMILVLFWPGWLVLGGTSFALWQFLG